MTAPAAQPATRIEWFGTLQVHQPVHPKEDNTMNEREALAGLLFTTDNSKAVSPWSEWEHCKQEPRLSEYVYAMADALIQAGYRRPRTITTVEELDALPIYSVVLAEGVAYQHYGQWEAGGDQIQWSAEGRWWVTSQVDLPATVLHEPEPLS